MSYCNYSLKLLRSFYLTIVTLKCSETLRSLAFFANEVRSKLLDLQFSGAKWVTELAAIIH